MKRHIVQAQGDNVIVLPKSTSAITPMLHMDDLEAVRLYQIYINSDHHLWLGVESFRKWADSVGIATEKARSDYIAYIQAKELKK